MDVHTTQSVMDRTCLVCHDRSPAPHLMLPMGNLSECLTDPYSSEFFCPTVCLFGALSVDFGPSWMHNARASCLFQPMSTRVSAFVPIRLSLPMFFPVCLCSLFGVYPVGNLSTRCNVSLLAVDLRVDNLSVCDSSPFADPVNVTIPLLRRRYRTPC